MDRKTLEKASSLLRESEELEKINGKSADILDKPIQNTLKMMYIGFGFRYSHGESIEIPERHKHVIIEAVKKIQSLVNEEIENLK